MNNAEYIALKNAVLGYRHGDRCAEILKEVNLSFRAGELVGIVGSNGVGKSTLLRTLAGLLSPLKGEVFIEGKNILSYEIEELAKKVAVVLTEKFGGFNLTLFDIVAAGRIPYTDSFHHLTGEHLEIIELAMERCGIKQLSHKFVAELSDGMFQKAIIAKALAQQTPCILLDEPSAFLDFASKHALFQLLRDLTTKEQKCVLVSSHELEMILRYCHKLLIISDQGLELIPCAGAKQNASFMQLAGGFL